MVEVGLLVRLKAKAGKEKEVEEFIKGALPLAQAEEDTITWYSFKISDNEFGIFDSFNDASGRDAHLNGEIAKALMANASELLSEDPRIEYVDILSAKGAE
jgi:quinol monooxygenase YgiN